MNPSEGIGIIVAILALIVSGLTLSRSMRADLRKDAQTEGAKDQLIADIRAKLQLTDGVADQARSLRQDVDGLKETASRTANGLQEHLLKCAESSGRIEQQMIGFAEGQASLKRSVESMQRMLATWMREKEHRDGAAG